MYIYKNYDKHIVKYDLINKFNYNIINKIPKINFIILSFKLKKHDLKTLISSLAVLQLLTEQKGILTNSKVSNISLKIRKGHPVGCKVILRKNRMNKFFLKLTNKIIKKYSLKGYKVYNFFSIHIKNILVFEELEQNYQFFKDLSDLTVQISTTNCNVKEFKFLLKSFKLLL